MPTSTPVVRLRGPAAIVAAVPHLLGFHPQESLVLLALQRRRVVLTLRVDLADADPVDLGARIAAAQADSAAVLVYTSAPDPVPCEPAGGGPWRAYEELAHTVAAAMPAALLDALLIRDGRWRSYLCAHPACCPPEGSPLPTEPSPVAVAMAVHSGRQALPDRAALVASVGPVPDGDPGLAAAVTVELAGSARAQRRRARAALARYAVVRDDPPILGLAEAATLLAALTDLAFRDWLLRRCAQRPEDGVIPLLVTLCRLAPDPCVAPAAAALAVAAYLQGDGSLANVALDRALAADPGYPLAVCLARALDEQVPPVALRDALLAAPARAGGRR